MHARENERKEAIAYLGYINILKRVQAVVTTEQFVV